MIDPGKKFADEKDLLKFIEDDGLHGIGVVAFPVSDGLEIHGASWNAEELEYMLEGAKVIHSGAEIYNQ